MWGATVYVLATGRAVPYHWHYGRGGMALVLEGTPTLRTPDGNACCGRGISQFFPRGEAGAHQLSNDTDEPVRAVFFSTVSDPEVCAYPDEDRIGVIAGWTQSASRLCEAGSRRTRR